MPRFADSPLCGMSNAECFLEAKEYVKIELITLTEDIKEIFEYENVCNCMPTCNSISYEADVSQSALVNGQTFANDLVLS